MVHDDPAAERAHMVRTHLQGRGVACPRVLAALARVPRERFVPESARSRAYADQALSIGHGQTISQPFMVAVMTQALELQEGARVLEVGTGSGYQAAVLAELAREIWSVELVPELARAAALLLAELGYANVHVRAGDGSLGWPEEAPFDAIVVTAGAPGTPRSLLAQLSPDGGRLVAPVGDRELQYLEIVERRGTEYVTRRSMGCRFVPLLGAEGWPG
ncbi:MAG TPA: protein-L-isoaspartate(D-aspartate) O-methyltransferase [Longimicrobiales bacterium]|nr:protein-L-isoaspartate(D-aspartate) O-methyltransferase [Longimicrobiales bacterium]